MPSTDTKAETSGKHRVEFTTVRDSRNRRIAGLAVRNGRFYAVLWAERGDGSKGVRRFPLMAEDGEPIRTITAAKDALDALKANRRGNALPQAGRKPSFDSFATDYLGMAATRAKKSGTLENEEQAINRWRAHIGPTRIDRVATPAIKSFIEMRLRGCALGGKKFAAASPRTVKLDTVALRNVLKAATDAGHLRELPRFPKLATPPAPAPMLRSG